jgi:hypothetical protein
MKTLLATALSVVALTSACAPTAADSSASPSQDPSAAAYTCATEPQYADLPPLTINPDWGYGTEGTASVSDCVIFDLANPPAWTIASDTAAGILELRTGATLEATAIGSGTATVTFTNGNTSVTFTINVRQENVACTAKGMIPDDTANEVLLAVRTFLAAYDTAIASGDTTTLAALFETSTAAKPWTDSAKRLHLAGAKRTYPFVDPQTACGVFDTIVAGQVFWSSGGPMYVIDEASDGSELDRVIWTALFCTLVESNGTWRIREAEFVD